MQISTGPARYFFLRHTRGIREDVRHWPPEIKPLSAPENLVCVAVYLYPEEGGWRAEPVTDPAAVCADAGGAFILTRETTLALGDEVHQTNIGFDLLGVRVTRPVEKGAEYAAHLIVRPIAGNVPRHAMVAPVDRLVLGAYVEHGTRAEAQLALRLSPEEFAALPPYLPDPVIERLANEALDRAILSVRARHEVKPEVEAGRVTLYGLAELTSTGDQAKSELLTTPGVVEVIDRLLYKEMIQQHVEEALAAKGLGHIKVLSEHGLIMLSGTVPDSATRYKAKDIALKIPGVRGVVVNDLEVPAPPEPIRASERAQTGSATHS